MQLSYKQSRRPHGHFLNTLPPEQAGMAAWQGLPRMPSSPSCASGAHKPSSEAALNHGLLDLHGPLPEPWRLTGACLAKHITSLRALCMEMWKAAEERGEELCWKILLSSQAPIDSPCMKPIYKV